MSIISIDSTKTFKPRHYTQAFGLGWPLNADEKRTCHPPWCLRKTGLVAAVSSKVVIPPMVLCAE